MAVVLFLEHFNYHCFGQAMGPVPTIRLSAPTNHSTETEQMVVLQYNTITPEMRNIHSFPSPLIRPCVPVLSPPRRVRHAICLLSLRASTGHRPYTRLTFCAFCAFCG